MNTSAEVFAEEIKNMVKDLGETFDRPDDDWHSMLFVDRGGEKVVVGIPGEAFADGQSKDFLVQILAKTLAHLQADRYALLLNAWAIGMPQTDLTPEEAEEQLMAHHAEWSGHYQDHPNAYEVLTLYVVDKERQAMWITKIERHEDAPPTLAEWELSGTHEQSGGRFGDLAKWFVEGGAES